MSPHARRGSVRGLLGGTEWKTRWELAKRLDDPSPGGVPAGSGTCGNNRMPDKFAWLVSDALLGPTAEKGASEPEAAEKKPLRFSRLMRRAPTGRPFCPRQSGS